MLIADWRLPGKPAPRRRPVVLPNGDDDRNADGSAKTLEIPYAGDSGILLRGQDKAQVNITCNTIGSGELYGYRVDKKMPAEVRAGAIPRVKADSPLGKWNRFVITLKKDRVTVVLNGQTVIDNVQLPGHPRPRPDRTPAPRRPGEVHEPVHQGAGVKPALGVGLTTPPRCWRALGAGLTTPPMSRP